MSSQLPRVPPAPLSRAWAVVGSVLVALSTLIVVDATLFRSGLYDNFVNPDSSVGTAVKIMRIQRPDSPELVAVLGDSRVGEAFSVRQFDDFMRSSSVAVRGLNLGMPGSSLRVWAMVLRTLDPAADRFRFVVIQLGDYDGYGIERGDPSDRAHDLSFMGPVQGLGGMAEFCNSYPDPGERGNAWLTSLFKAFAYRQDIRDMLLDPMARTSGQWRLSHALESSLAYEGRAETMVGVFVQDGEIAGLPGEISGSVRRRLHHYVFGSRVRNGVVDRVWLAKEKYRARWLGQICRRYAGSQTRVLLLRIPPAVLPPAEIGEGSGQLSPVLGRLAQLPHVEVVAHEKTAGLQAPRYFFDTTHLNRAGRKALTRSLAESVLALVK